MNTSEATGYTDEPRTWRVACYLVVPSYIPLGPNGEPPERLEPISRIAGSQETNVAGHIVSLREVEAPDGIQRDLRITWAELFLKVEAKKGSEAIEAAMPIIEEAIESLSFQLQAALAPASMEALDITPPVQAGEERPNALFPLPEGYPIRRFKPASNIMSGASATLNASLDTDLAALNRRERAALDWYLKALAASFQVDQFIFFWIAFEIFSDQSGHRQEAPLVLRCQHELTNCPECGASTSRTVQGASRKKFLVEQGASAEDANKLWNARQILHGAKDFDSQVMDDLPRLCHLLRSVVNANLKKALGVEADSLPRVDPSGLSIQPHIGLGGRRKVERDDLG